MNFFEIFLRYFGYCSWRGEAGNHLAKVCKHTSFVKGADLYNEGKKREFFMRESVKN